MKTPSLLRACLFAAVFLTAANLFAAAPVNTTKKETPRGEPAPLPAPAEAKSLAVYPQTLSLSGIDAASQLLITATLNKGGLQDLSADVQYETVPNGIVRVTSTGRVLPIANGKVELTARYGDKSAKLSVTT